MGKGIAAAEKKTEPGHRADYTLQRGVWRCTCRVCGWEAEGPARRQLASMFRFHLRGNAAQPEAPTTPS